MKNVLKKIIIFALLIILIGIVCTAFISSKKQNDISKVSGILFVSDSCCDCEKTKQYITEITPKLQEKNKHFNIKILSIDNAENKVLLETYNKKFNVEESKKGTIPILFIDKNYFIGYDSIRKNFYTFIEYRM